MVIHDRNDVIEPTDAPELTAGRKFVVVAAAAFFNDVVRYKMRYRRRRRLFFCITNVIRVYVADSINRKMRTILDSRFLRFANVEHVSLLSRASPSFLLWFPNLLAPLFHKPAIIYLFFCGLPIYAITIQHRTDNINTRNTSMSPTSRSDPRSYKCYLEADIRHQSLTNAKGPQGKHPTETLYRKMSSSWNVLKTIPQETGKYRSSDIQKPRASQNLDSKSSTAGVRNRCQAPNSEGMKKRDHKSKYDNLTYAQKVEMIVKDQMQWLKLKQSLREAGGSNFAVQQILHQHVQQRIDEMKQLELAMYECNQNQSLRNSNLPIFSEDEKKEEEQGCYLHFTSEYHHFKIRGMFSLHNRAARFNSLVEAKKTQLLGYIRRENWDRLIDHLESTKGSILTLGASSKEVMTESLLTLQVSNGRNALHIVCCVHPPVEVVRAIINVCPSCIEGVDRNGYTPLHCAAEWGASPQVVACLIYNYPQATTVTENRGKTPLILCCYDEWACDTGLRNDECFFKGGPLFGIIKALIKAAPQIINEEDADGLSALEYAIDKGARVSVVKALHKASEEAWKDNKRAMVAQEMLKRKLLLQSEQFTEAPPTVRSSESIKEMTPKTNLLMEYLAGRNPSRNFEKDGEPKNANSRSITQTEDFSSIHSASSPIEPVASSKVVNPRTSILTQYLAGNKHKK